MQRSLLILCLMMGTASTSGLAQASVRIEPANLHGSRVLPEQTASAAVRDYLLAWQSLQAAFEQNRPEMLDIGFVGIAKDKLAAVIARQAELKLRTRYLDPALFPRGFVDRVDRQGHL